MFDEPRPGAGDSAESIQSEERSTTHPIPDYPASHCGSDTRQRIDLRRRRSIEIESTADVARPIEERRLPDPERRVGGRERGLSSTGRSSR